MNGILTIQQVADRLGIHYNTAYRYVAIKGILKGFQMGGNAPKKRWRVKEDDLLAFINAGSGAGSREAQL